MKPKIDFDYLNQPIKLFGNVPSSVLIILLYGSLIFVSMNIVLIIIGIFILSLVIYLTIEYTKKKYKSIRLFHLIRALFKKKYIVLKNNIKE